MRPGSALDPARPRNGHPRLRPRLPRGTASTASALLIALALVWPGAGSAQYMYLDSNGDGVHTAADQVNPAGLTTFDVWLSPDRNRDGTVVTCGYPGPTTPISVFSYMITLRAVGGTVQWSGFVNRLPEAGISLGETLSSTEYNNGRASLTSQQGLTRLASLSVDVVSGTPSIQIVDSPATLETANPFTGFGSYCLAPIHGDNTFVLGVDWLDVDGLSFGVPAANHAPELTQPLAVTVPVGGVVVQALTATDPDGQPVSFSKADGPGFLFVETLDPGRGTATGEALLAPIYSDVGQFTGTIEVTDGLETDRGLFDISVTPVPNRSPAPGFGSPIDVVAGTVREYALMASDPDGQPLEFSLLSGPPWAEVTTLDPGRGAATGSLRLTPALSDIGTIPAVVSASDGVATVERSIEIQVLRPLPDPETAILPGPGSGGVALGDLDEDGHLDRIGGNQEVLIRSGLGDGTFGAWRSYPLEAHLLALAVDDVNGDGHEDVAAVTENPSRLSVLLGGGDGTLSGRQDHDTGELPQCVRLIDLNADGDLDAVIANSGADYVSVLSGRGNGTFAPRQDFQTSPGPIDLAVADFDRDGRLDLATANIGSRAVTVLLGRGDGTFGRRRDIATDSPTSFVVASDFNGDGILDLALGSMSSGVEVLTGRGDGTFVPGTPVPFSYLDVSDAAACDWNADGNMDLVIAGGDTFTILYGAGDGTFPSRGSFPGGQYRLALGDLNEDGYIDAVGGSVLLNQSSPLDIVPARAFVTSADRTVPVRPGGPDLEVRLEPVEGSYANAEVNLGSITLASEGTGSVSVSPAVMCATTAEGDSDGNGIAELPVCFASANLVRLFDGVQGRRTVSVRVQGDLSSGDRLSAKMDLTIVVTGKPLQVVVRPNPLKHSSLVRITTERAGFLRVRLFDLHGRLVRTIADVSSVPTGEHAYRIETDGGPGGPMAAGIYFLRVESPEGTSHARITVLK